MNSIDSSAWKSQHNLKLMFIAITILDSILVIVSKDLWAIGRIFLTIGVMHYVMQGRKWAKWLLVGIFSLVVVLLSALIIALYSQLSTFLIIGSLILIAMILLTSVFMISNHNLNRYFLIKRKANLQKE